MSSSSDFDGEYIENTQAQQEFDMEVNLLNQSDKDRISQSSTLANQTTQAFEERLPPPKPQVKKTKRKNEKSVDPNRASQVLSKPPKNLKK